MKLIDHPSLLSIAQPLYCCLLWHRDMVIHHGRAFILCAFILGAAMSYFDRALAFTMAADGVTQWPWVQDFRSTLRECGWRSDGLRADFANGLMLAAMSLTGPAILLWSVHFTYLFILRAGCSAIVLYWAPKITGHPNMDLILWTLLAGGGQAMVVTGILRHWKRHGHRRFAAVVENFGIILGLVVALGWFAMQFIPSLLSLLMLAQLTTEWLFRMG
jgi:hypothetical protein